MKMRLLFAMLACIPVGLHADGESPNVVHVSITLCRGECSEKRWAELVAPVQAMREQEDASMEDALDMVDAVAHSMRSIKRDGNDAFSGTISAMLSDGQCSSRCGDGCPCKETGACLCAVKGTTCSDVCGCVDVRKDSERGCADGACTRDDK